MMFALFAVVVSLLCTRLFGNTSWLSGTGLTKYDKAYIGEGGELRRAGESAMLPISKIYYNYSKKVQDNSVYNWGSQYCPDYLKYKSN